MSRGKILATVQRGKPKKFKNSAIFCQPAGWNRLLSKFGDSRKKVPWNLAALVHFFHQIFMINLQMKFHSNSVFLGLHFIHYVFGHSLVQIISISAFNSSIVFFLFQFCRSFFFQSFISSIFYGFQLSCILFLLDFHFFHYLSPINLRLLIFSSPHFIHDQS